MTIAENIAERLVYKAYADASMSATEPDPTTAPAITDGQLLRFVSQNISLTKDYFAANEKRPDRTQAMGRHGTRRAPGTINGLLSCATQKDLFEAATQGTWAAAVTGNQSDFTSVSADNSTSKFTFAGGNPVTKGFRVGHIVRFTNLADADNNSKNFLILEFGGSNNREVTVYPAPDTHSPDSAFSLTTVGKSLYRPTSSHVKRKFAFEVNNPDADLSRLFTEGRVGGFNLALPPNNNATVDFNVLCRGRQSYTGGSAPFFTAPTAATTTQLLAGVNGKIYINGSAVGVVTNMSLAYAMQLAGPSVVGAAGLVPDILLGEAAVTGNVTALLQDATLSDLFDDENEVALLCYLVGSTDAAAQAMSFYLPRIKLNTDQNSDGGDLGKQVSHDFAASTYEGSGAGITNSVIFINDTEVS